MLYWDYVLYPQWKEDVPCPPPPLCDLMDPLYYHSRIFYLMETPVQSKAYCPGVDKGGLGQSEYSLWSLEISTRLLEEVYISTILPLQALDTNLVRRHPVPPDAPLCGPHHRPRVGLPPLCCEATGYNFQGVCSLHSHLSVKRGKKVREVSALLQASLQIHLLLHPLCFF